LQLHTYNSSGLAHPPVDLETGIRL